MESVRCAHLEDVDRASRKRGGGVVKPKKGGEQLTICVEGNISAGKSTFLDTINAGAPRTEDGGGSRIRIVPEPVSKWTSIPGLADMGLGGAPSEHNILAAFYKDPSRWGYTFQNWVFFTRFMQERESAERPQLEEGVLWPGVDRRLMERSVFSDRLVFVEALKEDKTLNPMELSIYGEWFEYLLNDKPSLVPDGFIYLRAKPATCFNRMAKRNRSEEAGVPMKYLEILHDKHEGWFFEGAGAAAGKLHSDGSAWGVIRPDDSVESLISSYPTAGILWPDADWQSKAKELVFDLLPHSLRDKVRFMRTSSDEPLLGVGLHERIIRRVPALVLDCDGGADLLRDEQARAEYAGLVDDFYLFVARLKKNLYPLLGGPGGPSPTPTEAEKEELEQRFGDPLKLRNRLSSQFRCVQREEAARRTIVLPTFQQTQQLGRQLAAV